MPTKIIENQMKQSVEQLNNNNINQVDGMKLNICNDNTLEIPKKKLIGIIGRTGSGKSVVLHTLLQEKLGKMNSLGIISYASQEPWIFPGSIRQNILFGEEMDRERYFDVIKSCALLKDFEQFEDGDRTIIGERGASLSGGQKARIK